MFDKTINVKTIDLSGVNLPSDDEATCDLIYSALSTTYGFPIYLENFKVNGVKHDSVLVNPIISENQTIINLNDCHLIVTPTDISVGKGVYGASLESIVDKDGNPRFIEGDITMENIEGVTQTYGKWSLSGTHLMIVIAGNVANGTNLNANTVLAPITFPTYIYDKIIPIIPNTWTIDNKLALFYDINNGIQSVNVRLRKRVYAGIDIESTDSITINTDRSFRIQFDLLIDTDYDE